MRWFRLTAVCSFCSSVLPTRSEVWGSFVKLGPSTLRFTRKQCVLLTCWLWLVIIRQGPLFHLVLQMGICFGTEELGVLFELHNASTWLGTLLAVVGAQPVLQPPVHGLVSQHIIFQTKISRLTRGFDCKGHLGWLLKVLHCPSVVEKAVLYCPYALQGNSGMRFWPK